jgi:DNA-binding response OmpR family regulator
LTPHAHILVADDDPAVLDAITHTLDREQFEVETAEDGEAALEKARSAYFDVVILNVMMPRLFGTDVCRTLRAESDVPIILVSARDAELDRVLGLELGADDYLTKPFSIRELVARVKAVFRRIERLESGAATHAEETVQFGALEADVAKREVRVRGEPVSLTTKEFDLLLHFLRNPGRVYTRLQLLDAVWGYGYEGYEHNVNCHINRLRAKIEEDPADPAFILTVRGVGYRLGDVRPGALEG